VTLIKGRNYDFQTGRGLAMLGFLALVTYVPALSLWLPRALGMM
jgi:hypothetical protein